jgi:PKHD-type hydroxylase
MELLCLTDVLDAATTKRLIGEIADLPRVDGSHSAGWAAAQVKHNLQLDGRDGRVRSLQSTLHERLLGHPLLRLWARPQRMTLPLLNEHAPGMSYGRHVDDALMGDPPLRTDLAFTLFLTPPADYDGGELVIEGDGDETPVKLDAGACVVYAAGALHRVQPVTRGTRLAAVGWIQSQVRDPARRSVLFDLDRTRRELFERDGNSDAFAALSRCSGALVRMWAEP